jgi:hypothetical protein
MFEVQVINTSLSQKPMVSPYQRGTSGPSRGTAPSMLNSRPMWMLVTKLRATAAMICTSDGVTRIDWRIGTLNGPSALAATAHKRDCVETVGGSRR